MFLLKSSSPRLSETSSDGLSSQSRTRRTGNSRHRISPKDRYKRQSIHTALPSLKVVFCFFLSSFCLCFLFCFPQWFFPSHVIYTCYGKRWYFHLRIRPYQVDAAQQNDTCKYLFYLSRLHEHCTMELEADGETWNHGRTRRKGKGGLVGLGSHKVLISEESRTMDE